MSFCFSFFFFLHFGFRFLVSVPYLFLLQVETESRELKLSSDTSVRVRLLTDGCPFGTFSCVFTHVLLFFFFSRSRPREENEPISSLVSAAGGKESVLIPKSHELLVMVQRTRSGQRGFLLRVAGVDPSDPPAELVVVFWFCSLLSLFLPPLSFLASFSAGCSF